VRENRTLRLTRRALETESRDGLRHRHQGESRRKQLLPVAYDNRASVRPYLGGAGAPAVPI
jgi:hypothetical protein